MEFSRVVARLCSTGGATFASVYQLVGYSGGFVWEEAEDLACGDLDLGREFSCKFVTVVGVVWCPGEL